MSEESEFIDAPDESKDFVVDSAKGAVVRKPTNETGGRNYLGFRTHEPPEDSIEQNRLLYNTDPHVGHAVDITLDWLLADGYNINEQYISGSESEMDPEAVAQFRRLLRVSDFERKFHDWIQNAAVEGHGFMELVVQDEEFKARVLPAERMYKFTDEYGVVDEYILEPPEGGGPSAQDATVYKRNDIAEFSFQTEPLEEFGRSLIDRVSEQADMLRDMEIDYARFVASKAYPPILWKLGSEGNEWSENQISGWLDDVEEVEPDSMLGGPHDVEAEVVGTTSTSSSAGAMRLEETFKHHERRIVTGIGVPAVLANMDSKGGSAEMVMPSFKRRIKRYQSLIKKAVEQQIFKPLYVESIQGSSLEEYDGLVPQFEFGEHSSDEKRLEVDKLLKLFNNGMLSREAFASRAGIDPEQELPAPGELDSEIIPIIRQLAGGQAAGDAVQNPEGGRPTDTGGGAQTAGREVTSRDSATTDGTQDDSRPQKSPAED